MIASVKSFVVVWNKTRHCERFDFFAARRARNSSS